MSLVDALASTALNSAAPLKEQMRLGVCGPDSRGRWCETSVSRRRRRAAFVALGRYIARLQLRAIDWAISKLPNAPALIEMGTGLDPLEWIHNAGGGAGPYDVIVQCTSAAQRTNVETQLDSASIEHARPPQTAAQWWVSTGSTQFPDATEATWEIAEAYAATQSTQLGRLIGGAGAVADFLAVLTNVIQARQAALAEAES